MAKKNKKNRGSERPSATSLPPPEASKPAETVAAEAKKVEVAPPAVKPEEKREEKKEDKREEAASNVIQFPAQAKRSVSQLAVNDDVVGGAEEAPSSDDTQPRLKTEESDKAKAESETKSERPPAEAPKSTPPPARAADAEDRDERKEKRKKKAPTTESGEMRALGTGDHAVVTEEFFTTKKKATPVVEHDDFADLQRSLEPMSAERKQAMWATAGIVLVGLVAIGSYYYYQNYHMPQPVQLGRAGPVEMPQLATSGGTATPPATTEVAPPATTEVAPPATTEVAPPATTEVAPPATTEVAPPATTEVAPPATTEVAPPATTEVAPPATTEVAPPATTEVAAPAETYESVLAQAVAARGAARQMPLLQRAIELNPSGADALARLSYIYIQRPGRANMEQARSLAERATAADPTNSQGWLVLGAARSELGDRAGARAAFDACIAQGTGRYVAECRASR